MKKVIKVFSGLLLIGFGGTFLTSATTFFYHTFTDLALDMVVGLFIRKRRKTPAFSHGDIRRGCDLALSRSKRFAKHRSSRTREPGLCPRSPRIHAWGVVTISVAFLIMGYGFYLLFY